MVLLTAKPSGATWSQKSSFDYLQYYDNLDVMRRLMSLALLDSRTLHSNFRDCSFCMLVIDVSICYCFGPACSMRQRRSNLLAGTCTCVYVKSAFQSDSREV